MSEPEKVWTLLVNFTASEERAIELQDQLGVIAQLSDYDDAVTVLRPGRREEAYSDHE